MKLLLQKPWIWLLSFGSVLFLAMLPFFSPFSDRLYSLGIPAWTWYLIAIHLLLVLALYYFGKHYIQDES